MKKVTFLIVLILACWIPMPAIEPSQMPNVQAADYTQYVSDPSGLLSSATKTKVNEQLAQLRKQTTVEAVVAIPDSIGNLEPVQWCEQLFTDWGIGKSDKDNGVLLMVSPGSRCAFIMTGYGVEGALPDISCNKIVNRAVIPNMKAGDLDAAVSEAVSLICNALTDPSVAAELKSSQPDTLGTAIKSLDSQYIWMFVEFVVGLLFLLALFLFVRDCFRARKCNTNYTKAELWRDSIPSFIWLAVFSLGAGLIFLLLAWGLYRFWRMRPLKCSTCGARMKRLPEDKDNELLSDSQDFEERIKTVDYDVWECPKCGTIERFPFKSKQKKYTECPRCHTVAMCLECDMTTQAPTTRAAGKGLRVYECKYCHNRIDRPYVIPKKEDASAAAAVAAGAILGAGLGGRRGGGFGGGSMGGGFGGGSTGGGGAGGRW